MCLSFGILEYKTVNHSKAYDLLFLIQLIHSIGSRKRTAWTFFS